MIFQTNSLRLGEKEYKSIIGKCLKGKEGEK